MFKANNKFKCDYNRLYRRDPAPANTFLLFAELADESGQIVTTEEELTALFNTRFGCDHRRYSI
jgi:hypothetical protein